MNRRGLFASLLALPFLFLPKRTNAEVRAFATQLQPGELLEQVKSKKIRLWKLGSLEHRLYPTQKAVERLTNLIEGWDGESDLDIIWDEAISLEQIDLDTNAVDIIVPCDGEFVTEPNTSNDLELAMTVTPKIRIISKETRKEIKETGGMYSRGVSE